jgi:hypothetical protein
MTIDRVTVNLYICCKCKHQWIRWNGNGNGNGNGDREAEQTIPVTTTIPLPKRCPKCKCVRWNQRYLDEELALIEYTKQD